MSDDSNDSIAGLVVMGVLVAIGVGLYAVVEAFASLGKGSTVTAKEVKTALGEGERSVDYSYKSDKGYKDHTTMHEEPNAECPNCNASLNSGNRMVDSFFCMRCDD